MHKLFKLVLYSSGAIALAITYYTISVFRNRRKYRHIPGRNEKGIKGFYFGSALDIINDNATNRLFTDNFIKDVEQFGSVIKYGFLNKTFIHTVDPDAIREILITEDFPKHPLLYKNAGFPLGERLLGTGLVTDTYHEHWRQRRSLFNPGFYRQELYNSMSIFNAKSDLLVEKLRKLADGKTVITLFNEISHATSDLISSIAFGLENDSINDTNNKLNLYIAEIFKLLELFIFDPLIAIKPHKQWIRSKFRTNLNLLRGYAREKIIERIEMLKNDEYTHNDILGIILKGVDKGNFDIEAMIDDFLTFFIAGQETTATTLSFFFLEAGKNPEILKKIEKEINEVLGERMDVRYDDINKFQYIDAVWKETLRLYPPVPQISRISTKEIIINGIKIPSGTWISCSSYSSGRCAKFFPDPLKFDPDRFIDEKKRNENLISAYTWFPFSIGSRSCIGLNFAAIEAKVIIVKLFQQFDITIDQNQSFAIMHAITIRPQDGTKCYLKPKHS